MQITVSARLARAVLILLSLSLSVTWGQTSRGTITGIIADPTGASVPNASVEITHETTGVTRSTTTNDSGFYRFDAVDLGTYTVSVKQTGFRTFVRRAVPISGGLTSSVDVQLEVGETQTTIEVVSSAVLLQQETVARGGSISIEAATQLPFSTRNPVSLALTLPGVTSNRYGFGQQTFIVNGSRGRSNNFMIDGVENNDTGVAGQSLSLANPEVIQEVSVQTSNYDAEYGRAGGAVVNTITKPGTNDFHGAGFYLVDSTFDDAITNTQSLSEDVKLRGRPLFRHRPVVWRPGRRADYKEQNVLLVWLSREAAALEFDQQRFRADCSRASRISIDCFHRGPTHGPICTGK